MSVIRIGISVSSSHPVPARPQGRVGADEMVARAQAASRASLDSLFVGDHHVTPQPYYQNVPILARMLAEWGDAPAGALFLLPLWHPVLLAEQVATLACIARGPFVLQCALGRDDAQFTGFGISARDRIGRFETTLEILRALWAGETVDEPRWYGIRAARIAPLPPQPVPVWIGASALPAIERAARLGDAWLADPGLDPDAARARLDTYRQARARAGLDAGCAVIRRDVHLAGNGGLARAQIADRLARGHRGIDPSALIVGGPDEAEAALRGLAASGYSEVLVRNISTDPGHARQSIEVLGEVRKRLAGG